MKNTFKKSAMVVLGLGLTTASSAFAFGGGSHLGGGHLGGGGFRGNHFGGGGFKANHALRNNRSFNNHAVFANKNANSGHLFHSGNHAFAQQHTMTINKTTKTFTSSNSKFIHATPSFNNVHSNTIVKTHVGHHSMTVTHMNNKIAHTDKMTTHVVANHGMNKTVIHSAKTYHIGPKNGNVVIKKPVIVNHTGTPVVINHNHVVVTRPYGVTPIIVHQPVIYGPYPNYWHNYNHYYNYGYWNNYNDVNDVLAVALGLSLIGNVAQFAAANNHTNTVVYPTTSAYVPYAPNTMSVYQPIPYAPSSSSKTTHTKTSQPVNVSVNTTVNTTTPAAANSATTTTSSQSTTTTAAADAPVATVADAATPSTSSLADVAGSVGVPASSDVQTIAATSSVDSVNDLIATTPIPVASQGLAA